MTRSKTEPPANMTASVKTRLLKLAQHNGEDFNTLLTRYKPSARASPPGLQSAPSAENGTLW